MHDFWEPSVERAIEQFIPFCQGEDWDGLVRQMERLTPQIGFDDVAEGITRLFPTFPALKRYCEQCQEARKMNPNPPHHHEP